MPWTLTKEFRSTTVRDARGRNVVYALFSLFSGKVYVGQAANLRERLGRHRRLIYNGKHPNKHLERAWKRDGEGSFRVAVLEVVEDPDRRTNREQFWMDLFEVNNSAKGFNVALVAEGPPMLGRKHAPQSVELMRRNSTGMKGRRHTDETKARMSESLRRHYQENPHARLRMAELNRRPRPGAVGKKNPETARRFAKAFVAFDPDGKEYRATNLRAFCKTHGLSYKSMRVVAKSQGRPGKNYRGWRCRYVSDIKNVHV